MISRVMCPVLCSPVQERHEHTAMFPENRHKDHKRTGASVLWGEPQWELGLCSAGATAAPSQWAGSQKKIPGGLHGWKRSFQQNTKNKACRNGNTEGTPGRNTEILAEHAEMQLGKWKPTWNWALQGIWRTTRKSSLSMQVTKGRLGKMWAYCYVCQET